MKDIKGIRGILGIRAIENSRDIRGYSGHNRGILRVYIGLRAKRGHGSM